MNYLKELLNKVFGWYFTKKSLPYWAVFLADCSLVVFSMFVSYMVVMGRQAAVYGGRYLLGTLLIYLFIYILCFRLFRTYRGVLHLSSFKELRQVTLAMMLGTLLAAGFRFACNYLDGFTIIPYRCILVTGIVACVLMLLVRIIMSNINEVIRKQRKEMEDLLPREVIEVNMPAIGNMLTGERILITGAAGSIGSELVRQIAPYHPDELILVDQAETPMHDLRLEMAANWAFIKSHTLVANICNPRRMEQIFQLYKPAYVFHAAAYKHVPMMEDNPSESVENNVLGTRVVADLAVKYRVKKFVMISTDKAVNPTNVMGCSKRICEIYVQSLNKAIQEGKVKGITQFVTTRFGNVLGSNGSVIPLFKKQIKAGGPVTVTHPDITRFFMLIPEACKLVLEAGTRGKGGEIFVFDMGEPVRIADLAKAMIARSNHPHVQIKYVGLRDGEKLFEEVLDDAETTIPTSHPKIKVAKVREYDYAKVCEDLEQLLDVCSSYDDMAIVSVMKDLVPEFISKHSKYEKLDRN